MECKNCKEKMTKLKKGVFYCEKCNEMFEVKDDKQEAVKDKKKIIGELEDAVKGTGSKIKDIANALGFGVKSEDDDDDGLFFLR